MVLTRLDDRSMKRRVYVGSVNGFLRPAQDVFTISGTPISISLSDVFTAFDEIQAPA